MGPCIGASPGSPISLQRTATCFRPSPVMMRTAAAGGGVVARIVAGPHDANRQNPYLPMRYDAGRPRAVIRFKTLRPRTTSAKPGLRARRPSPMMDLYRKNVSVSNSLSGRHWELDQVPAVGDPTNIVQFGTGHHVAAGEGQRRVALQRRVAAYLVVVGLEVGKCPFKITGIPEQHMVETFSPGAPQSDRPRCAGAAPACRAVHVAGREAPPRPFRAAAVARAAPTTRSRGTSPPHRPPSSRHRCRVAPALADPSNRHASVLLHQCAQKYHDRPRWYKAYLKSALSEAG